MRRKKRSLWLLLISLLTFVTLLYIIFSYPPGALINISEAKINIASNVAFFGLLFIFCTSFFGILFHSTRRGVIIGIFVVIYLLLRLFGLRNIFFLVLLIAIFATIELSFNQRQ